MALRDLIHGGTRSGGLATAIPAISATEPDTEDATVARIATVAVANPRSEEATPTQGSTRAGRFATAISAISATEPDADRPRPLTPDETRLLNWWLDAIAEDDPQCRHRVLELAATRRGARGFFVGLARERRAQEEGGS